MPAARCFRCELGEGKNVWRIHATLERNNKQSPDGEAFMLNVSCMI